MIFDAVLSLIYGFFAFFIDLLPIPAMPEWYLTDIFPLISVYVAKGTKLISFVFPGNLWSFLVDFTKDCILCRLLYDLYTTFTPLKKAAG